MKKVTIDGVAYLGDLKEGKDGKYTLKNALRTKSSNKGAFISYLQRKNVGTLETVEFGGQGVSFSISELNDTEELNLAMCKLAMKHAKKVAVAGTENKVFEEILGKR